MVFAQVKQNGNVYLLPMDRIDAVWLRSESENDVVFSLDGSKYYTPRFDACLMEMPVNRVTRMKLDSAKYTRPLE